MTRTRTGNRYQATLFTMLTGLVFVSGCSDHLPAVGDPDWPNGLQLLIMLGAAVFFLYIAYNAGYQAGHSEGYNQALRDERGSRGR